MQGVQKTKCVNCGTMFISETSTNICPSCSEPGHGQGSHEGISGCGCGHSH
jgi:Zn finger protein HypA/HybF involved in hydrogenase expression